MLIESIDLSRGARFDAHNKIPHQNKYTGDEKDKGNKYHYMIGEFGNIGESGRIAITFIGAGCDNIFSVGGEGNSEDLKSGGCGSLLPKMCVDGTIFIKAQ